MLNGFTQLEHAEAPRNSILKRDFNWQVGQYCVEHPELEHDQAMIQRTGGRCAAMLDKRTPCNLALQERPRWFDTYLECKKDQGYAVYKIYDSRYYQRDWLPDQETYITRHVPAHSIVTDFITIYSGGMPGADKGFRAGIIAIDGDMPTEEELERVRAQQTAHFTYLFNDAVSSYASQKTELITDLHRDACSWLGRDDLPFLKKIRQVSVKDCPACGESIMAAALRCHKCTANLPEWYASYGITPESLGKEDEAVSSFLLKLPANKEKMRYRSSSDLGVLATAAKEQAGLPTVAPSEPSTVGA